MRRQWPQVQRKSRTDEVEERREEEKVRDLIGHQCLVFCCSKLLAGQGRFCMVRVDSSNPKLYIYFI